MNRKTLLLAVLALAASSARADQTVNFNVQLNLTKIDAQVTAVGLKCVVMTQDKATSLAESPDSPPNPAPVGAGGVYSGSMSVPVTVPSAKVSQAKAWSCRSLVRGPGNVWATFGAANSPSWALKAAGAGSYYVEGMF